MVQRLCDVSSPSHMISRAALQIGKHYRTEKFTSRLIATDNETY